jgi:sigma-E factor negative regulatory protein RseA
MTQEVTPDELVSALADGQLHGAEFARAVELTASSQKARMDWHVYHLVGDLLRSGDTAAHRMTDIDFVERLRPRLERELGESPAAVSTEPLAEGMRQPFVNTVGQPLQESANDAVMRWKLVAGLSSLAVVVAIGWHLADGWEVSSGTGKQLAQRLPAAPEMPVNLGPNYSTMMRDPELDRLLAAHQQLGGISALQTPAGFLRNATYEKPSR